MTSLNELRSNLLSIINKCRTEQRNLTDEEQKIFDEQKNEMIALAESIKNTNDKLDELEAQLPEVKAEEPVQQEEEKPVETEVENPVETQEESPVNEEERVEEQVEEETETVEEQQEEVVDETVETETEVEENTQDKYTNKRNITTTMNKNFSLVRTIRSIVNNQNHDELTSAVLAEGQKNFRSSGIEAQGQIQLPESRAITVATEHDDVIETEFQSILEPLYAQSVISELGIKRLSGLKGDVQYPVMGKGSCGWAGEMDEAAETNPQFTNIKLTPHRITSVMVISKQLLAQDSIGVENALRADIVNALNDKLEATLFGTAAADAGAPAGLLNGLVATPVTDFKTLTEFESGVEEKNIPGEKKYLLSPSAKAALRNYTFGGKSTRMVYENGDIDGTPSVASTNIASKTFAYGAWDNCVLADWSGLDITVDPYTLSHKGAIRLVINAYFDFKVLREGAIRLATVNA
jgi:HK97 family phage major capsid protein